MGEQVKRVVLITVDSLRADALGLYGAPGPTPALDALAEEALVFENAFATGPHTTQSFPGILASNYPTSGGTVQNLAGRRSVAEVFQAAGWRTAGFHSNPLLSRSRGYGRGFETFWDSLPEQGAPGGAAPSGDVPGAVDRIGAFVARHCRPLFRLARWTYRTAARRVRHVDLPHEPAERVNEQALEWLRATAEPWFLWLHYMDPHWPYATRVPELPEAERREAARLSDKALRHPDRLTADDIAQLRRFYAAEVRHLDGCLGALFDALKARGLWDGTAVFVTADHGQAFREHGTTFHGDVLYDELIRVPLIVKAPGLGAERRGGVASLIDLAPTLCEVAGLAAPETFEGQSLLTVTREAAFAETAYRLFVSERPKRAAVRTLDWKLLLDSEAAGEELYHVATDPGEQHDVAGERPEEAARMRGLYEQHVGRPRPTARAQPEERPADDEVVKARLRALGYMDEADGPAAEE